MLFFQKTEKEKRRRTLRWIGREVTNPGGENMTKINYGTTRRGRELFKKEGRKKEEK